jgi:hypothetical protein
VRAYREFDGQRVATEGEAIWHCPEGELVYGRMMLRVTLPVVENSISRKLTSVKGSNWVGTGLPGSP